MSWKLIIILSLVGALLGVVLGYLIFFGAPQLSNFNVEEYLLVGVLSSAGLTAFIAFRRAPSRKTFHALIVFAAVCVLTIFVYILLVLFFLFVVCGLTPCKLIPFL